jgi:hypothetical protein
MERGERERERERRAAVEGVVRTLGQLPPPALYHIVELFDEKTLDVIH